MHGVGSSTGTTPKAKYWSRNKTENKWITSNIKLHTCDCGAF